MFRTLLGISSHNSSMPKSQFDMGNVCALRQSEEDQKMGVAAGMKDIVQDIVSSRDVRAAEVKRLVKEASESREVRAAEVKCGFLTCSKTWLQYMRSK